MNGDLTTAEILVGLRSRRFNEAADWIESENRVRFERQQAKLREPLVTPAGTIEAGQRYNVTVKGHWGSPTRTLKNVELRREIGWGGSSLRYPSNRTALRLAGADIGYITAIEKVTP